MLLFTEKPPTRPALFTCASKQTSAQVRIRHSIRQHMTAYISIQTIRASYSNRFFSGTVFQSDIKILLAWGNIK